MFLPHESKFQTNPVLKRNKVVIVDDDEEDEDGLNVMRSSMDPHMSFGSRDNEAAPCFTSNVHNDLTPPGRKSKEHYIQNSQQNLKVLEDD